MGSLYGIDRYWVNRCDVNKHDLICVVYHVERVQVGGWGECEHGGVSASGYDGDSRVSWQVDKDVVDEDGAMSGACGP